MKKVKVMATRTTEYAKEIEIEDDVFEYILEGIGMDDAELAGETFKEMDAIIESEDYSNENFSYESDYCILDESGGVLVRWDDEGR